jgi:hypothetical protein
MSRLVMRFAPYLWLLVLIVYYVTALLRVSIFIAQFGFDAVNGSAIAHALLFDEIVTFTTDHPVVGAILLIVGLGLIVSGEVSIVARRRANDSSPTEEAPTPTAPSDARIAQVTAWLDEDPVLIQQFLPLLGSRLLMTLKDAIREELASFGEKQRGQALLNLYLEITGLLLGIFSLLPVVIGVLHVHR